MAQEEMTAGQESEHWYCEQCGEMILTREQPCTKCVAAKVAWEGFYQAYGPAAPALSPLHVIAEAAKSVPEVEYAAVEYLKTKSPEAEALFKGSLESYGIQWQG